MENENQEVLIEENVGVQSEFGSGDLQEQNLEIEQKIEKNQQNLLENQDKMAKNTSKSKKHFNFKLFLSILFVIIMVGVITGISTCSCIEKSFDFGFNAPAYIKLHTEDKTSSSNNQIFAQETKQYQNIIELYNKSFKTTLLNSILQGKAKNGVTAKEGYKSISESSLNGAYMEFFYNEVQQIYLNGEKYEANIVGDESYYVIVIEVLNSNSLTEINAYFKYRSNSSTDYSYVRFTSFAVQAELYDYISNL